MLIKLIENAFVAGSKWTKGTTLECPDPDAKKAIEGGYAEATSIDASSKKIGKKAK